MDSNSREHIIPESLGNKEHILPPGWVCDKCNNYISRKIEFPFLDSWYGRNIRFEMEIPNKRKNVPSAIGFHVRSGTEIEISNFSGQQPSISAKNGKDESRFIKSILENKSGTLLVPASTLNLPENDYNTARFIAKIALEIFAFKNVKIERWNDEIVDNIGLNDLRNYVRLGRPNFVWPVRIRRIYSADRLFEENHVHFQTLHEFDTLILQKGVDIRLMSKVDENVPLDVLVVLCIFGIEYVINLGEPDLKSYDKWLKLNQNKSYLYSKL